MFENRAEARIDLSRLSENIELLKKTSKTNLLAVVKADAYGHGLVEVAKAAETAGADWLGVALLEEAITLRKNGIKIPVLAWLVPPGSDFQSAVDLDIDIAIVTFKWNDGKEISVEETWALGNGRILLLTAMGILIYCDG